jgi:hypothetical protein
MAWYRYIDSINSMECIRSRIFYHNFITPFGLGNLEKVLGHVESAGGELCEEENLIGLFLVPFSYKGSNPGPAITDSAGPEIPNRSNMIMT